MKPYENQVLVTGQIDSSLERSIGLSVQELDRFKRALEDVGARCFEVGFGATDTKLGSEPLQSLLTIRPYRATVR